MQSHPTWVRGLKHVAVVWRKGQKNVAPYVGAWIETIVSSDFRTRFFVAPYVGAWIETFCTRSGFSNTSRRTLRGCVD